jgi:hypothetical protein
MTPALQFLTNRFPDLHADLQAAQARSALSERAGVVLRGESGRLERRFRRHAKLDVIQDQLQAGLVLQIGSRPNSTVQAEISTDRL